MKFHTYTVTRLQICEALAEAQTAGEVAPEVTFTEFGYAGSRTHPHAFTFKLGSFEKVPGRPNRRQNGGCRSSEGLPYAATWDEWGWFLVRLFDQDPDAKTDYYKDRDDFHRQTNYKFTGVTL